MMARSPNGSNVFKDRAEYWFESVPWQAGAASKV